MRDIRRQPMSRIVIRLQRQFHHSSIALWPKAYSGNTAFCSSGYLVGTQTIDRTVALETTQNRPNDAIIWGRRCRFCITLISNELSRGGPVHMSPRFELSPLPSAFAMSHVLLLQSKGFTDTPTYVQVKHGARIWVS